MKSIGHFTQWVPHGATVSLGVSVAHRPVPAREVCVRRGAQWCARGALLLPAFPHQNTLTAGRAWEFLSLVGVMARAWLATPTVVGQPLEPALCPACSPFNISPPLHQCVFEQPGIPLVRSTSNTQRSPDAVGIDGSLAVMDIRPAYAAFGGNLIVPPSTKGVLFLDGGAGCRTVDECLLIQWGSGGDALCERARTMRACDAWPARHAPGGICALAPPVPFLNHCAADDHVLVYDCSSDHGSGAARHTSLTTATGTGYDLQWHAEAIINVVMLQHPIITPVFLCADIADPLTLRPYVDWQLYAAGAVYWTTHYAQLALFLPSTATMGSFEPLRAAPGLHGPEWRHLAVQSTDGFYHRHRVGPACPGSCQSLLVNGRNGVAPWPRDSAAPEGPYGGRGIHALVLSLRDAIWKRTQARYRDGVTPDLASQVP